MWSISWLRYLYAAIGNLNIVVSGSQNTSNAKARTGDGMELQSGNCHLQEKVGEWYVSISKATNWWKEPN